VGYFNCLLKQALVVFSVYTKKMRLYLKTIKKRRNKIQLSEACITQKARKSEL